MRKFLALIVVLLPLSALFSQSDDYFAVSEREIFIDEGEEFSINAEARGAINTFWIRVQNGIENIVAEDTLSYTIKAGRIDGDQHDILIFRAVYPDLKREISIPVTIFEDIPEPEFSLDAPVNWNGRDSIVVMPHIRNMDKLTLAGVSDLDYDWSTSRVAVVSDAGEESLKLKYAQNSGLLLVKLSLGNGGPSVNQTIAIRVHEGDDNEWEKRNPGPFEKPLNNSFIAREDDNKGTLYYSSRIKERVDSISLRIYAGDELYLEKYQVPGDNNTFSIEARIEAGLVQYNVELWAIKPKEKKLIERVTNIICGDVYLINGQSNAVANDGGRVVNKANSNWLRSFGYSTNKKKRGKLGPWGNAVSFAIDDSRHQIGYWGMELGMNIIRKHKIPVCIINGAVGGTRIDQHQRNDSLPEDPETIYGRLLAKVKEAGLCHGVRGIIWHQGESDQGDDGPGPGYDWENYENNFNKLTAAWTEDYPNVRNFYMFQIRPGACGLGMDGSGNMLREVQRSLKSGYSNLQIMSSLGIKAAGECHYPEKGYEAMADLILPLIERDNYGLKPGKPINPPDLINAWYTSQRRNEIALEFDQPMDWDPRLISEFYLDGMPGMVESGSLWGSKIILKLKERSNAATISYLDGKDWDQDNILYGRNGIAALTFCNVEISGLKNTLRDPVSVLERSDIEQPYEYLSGGEFRGDFIPESPDPLISYVWPYPDAEDDLEVFILKPVKVETDYPDSFEGYESLTSSKPSVLVKGGGSLILDFGVEMPAWIEFDSHDCPGGISISISEYNQPGVRKTAVPVRYGDTYRLELNNELYEGVRFAWIHVEEFTEEWHISDVRAINQVKPVNYIGSFSCSDQVLTKTWYMSAYSVRAAMNKEYFGAILMDRGDRHSWTGDAHPIQAASLVAFGNYDFVRKNLISTADVDHGINSYSLLWVLSLIDYYKYSGDREFLEENIGKATNKLDNAYQEYGTDPALGFYGWDERLAAGFDLWFMEAPEAQLAYKMLSIRTWLEFAELMQEIGRGDLESKYSWWARRKLSEARQDPNWPNNMGMHSSADALTTGQLTQREKDSIFIRHFVNRSDRQSLSPFNQYFILQALAEMNKHDDALSTIRDIWGGMLEHGATTPYEVFRPSWNDFLNPNDPVPNSQSGIVSLCHPWGAGPVKWLNEEILGIEPLQPGFKNWQVAPETGRRLEWVKGSTATPNGEITMFMDIQNGHMEVSGPPGTVGRIGIPRMGRFITRILVNGELAWDGLYQEVEGIGGSSSDDEFIYLDSVLPGYYDIDFEYEGSISFYVEPHYQFTGEFHGTDSISSGNWGGKYGEDGYVLCNYKGNSNDMQSLPSYIDSVSYFMAFPRTENQKPEAFFFSENTTDSTALASSRGNDRERTASGYSCIEQTMTFTIHANTKRNFRIALYFADWDDEDLSQVVEMFDAETLNLLTPVKRVDNFRNGKYLVFSYNNSVKFRINKIRGSKIVLNGIFFDPML